jgi:hypothetical protein
LLAADSVGKFTTLYADGLLSSGCTGLIETLSAGRLLAIPLLRRLSPWRMLRGCLGLGLSVNNLMGLHS